jgi:hypothetical protein
LARLGRIDHLSRIVHILDLRNESFGLEPRFSHLTLDRRTVHGNIAEVGEELLRSILRSDEPEEFRRVVDKGRPGLAGLEDWMGEEADKEGDVGLGT